MKIGILSDMHIQENQRASNFKHSDKELYNLFKYLDKEYDNVYLVGDIFECQQTLWYPTQHQQHQVLTKTIQRYSSSFDYIAERSEKFIYLSGNHDSILHEGDFNRIPIPLQKIYQGRLKRIHIAQGIIDIRHGEEKHEYDTPFKYLLWLGTWLGGLYERITDKNIPMIFTTGIGEKIDTYPKKEFIEVCTKEDSVIIGVRGHNHIPENCQIEINGEVRKYLNTGFSDKDTIRIGTIDTNDLSTEIHSYKMSYFQ